jgi:ABC-type Fe3+-siderophore transport system permease subunit
MTASPRPAASSNALSLASLIVSIFGALLILVFFVTTVGAPILWIGAVAGLAAVILGVIALNKRQSKALALTGFIIGALCVVIAVGLFIFALIFVGAFIS